MFLVIGIISACSNTHKKDVLIESNNLESSLHFPDSISKNIEGIVFPFSIDTLHVTRTLKTIKQPPVIKDYPFSKVKITRLRLDKKPKLLDIKIKPQEEQKRVPKFGVLIEARDTIYGPEKVDVIWPESIDNIKMTRRENSNTSISYLSLEIFNKGGKFLHGVFRDSRNHLWISDFEQGVSRFDGHSITKFTKENGLKNNYAHVTYEDNNNNLWFGLYSFGGLTMFDGESLLNFSSVKELKIQRINSIFQDKSNRYWIGTNDGLILLYEHEDSWSFQLIQKKDGLPNAYINKIKEDQTGTIWIATNGGLVSYSQDTFKHHRVGHIMDLSPVGDDGIWLASYQRGLMKYERGSFYDYKFQGDDDFRELLSVHCDENEGVWFGSAWGEGLGYLNGEEVLIISKNEGLSGGIIREITPDDSGNLWLATYDGGLNKLNPNSFKYWGKEDEITEGFVIGLTKDTVGKKHIISFQGGLTTFSDNGFQIYKNEFSLGSDRLISCFIDSKDNLWLGSHDFPFIRYKDGVSEIFWLTTKDGKAIAISSINEDSEGNIWMGTISDTVIKYDGKHFLYFNFGNNQPNRWISNVAIDNQDGVWFWRHDGIVRYINNKCFLFFNNPGAYYADEFFIEAGKDQTLWFGDERYIGKIYPNTKGDQLVDEVLYFGNSGLLYGGAPMDIISEDKGILWVTTNNGLSRLAPQSQKGVVGYQSTNMGSKQDLFKSANGNSLVIEKDKLWMGGNQEFGYKDISSYTPNNKIPKIQLHTINVKQEHIQYNKLSDSTYSSRTLVRKILARTVDSLVPFTNLPGNFIAPYYINHLTFRFSAVDWSAPANVEYQFMLEGVDNQWSEPTYSEFADYRNIPHGEHNFLIRSKGSSGIWSEPFSYRFLILPPWWQTWWAYTMYILIVIGLIYTFSQWRVSKLRQEQERQANIKAKMNQLELNALRAQMNPHFIFNTLNNIQSAIILKGERTANKLISAFSKLMRLTLNMSKSEYLPLVDEISYISSYLELEENRLGGNLETSIEVSDDIDLKNTLIPCMLFQPIIENALIHGLQPKKDNRKLDIKINQSEGFIIGQVEDNGIGRAAAETNKQKQIARHKSLATQILNERIEINNTNSNLKMSYDIIDLYNNGKPSGTKVILNIPIYLTS
ncbi:two-component regulator propeller domain-containing protein [uncultured Winogradskyella sp.]|uniref:two-component regulator propeller domain-containing protein n=1 Tax=uncultured Winogradskyella sp. TaxID=395353 RepID=UPI00260D924B|nr:two-component regulator propeller domain-containing protein [uncultured Winogradskyella sp.]